VVLRCTLERGINSYGGNHYAVIVQNSWSDPQRNMKVIQEASNIKKFWFQRAR